MRAPVKSVKGAAQPGSVFLFLCLIVSTCFGQSIDINSPSPVRTNEVVGSIAARDLGDSRLTDHFYAFIGKPGDVLVTVKSNNLNGDIDIFTAGSLRPLMKFTLYAENDVAVTKSLYLRKREALILRVEARTPNDDEGIYQIRLGGSFESIAGEPLVAAAEQPDANSIPTATSRSKGRRVSSVGARIPEPQPTPAEIAAAPAPEPSPVETPAPAAPENVVETKPARSAPRKTTTRPPARGKRPAARAAKNDEAAIVKENETKATVVEPKPRASARRTAKRGAPETAQTSPLEPEQQTGPRLIVEMQDGTRVERFMSTIRRVTVENNQIVVVAKEGKIERIRMAEVIRMSIEP